MELCFNEMTVMKNGALPEDIALCAQAGFSAVELSALRGDRLFMVHVSDCPARAPFTAQRAESYWPGEGDAPLEELLRSVRAIGYDGPLLCRGHGPERARPAGGRGHPPRGGNDEAAACAGGAVSALSPPRGGPPARPCRREYRFSR